MSRAPKRRAPVARHSAKKAPNRFAQFAKLVGICLAAVIVSAAGIGGFVVWNTAQTIGENSVSLRGDGEELPPTIGAIEGGFNLLMVGTDSCEGQDLALFPRCAHDDGGERNDVTMLVDISDDPRRVTVVSFPRDLLVDRPACPAADGGTHAAASSVMINSSYANGGLGCTALTVEALTGEQVHGAASIRWTGVINMSDALGGVDVCVNGEIDDRHTGLHLTEGNHTLQGAKALQFLRLRHGIGDGSDLGRISNQQQFMSSLVRKLQSDEVLSNPSTLLTLATTALTQVSKKQLVLSERLTNPQLMVQIAMAVKDVDYSDIVFVQYPTIYDPLDDDRVLPVTEAANVLFAALRDNKAVALTGEASQGYGVEVEGAAPKPTSSSTAPTGASASPSPTAADAAVELPSAIAGTTAGQVTCTRRDINQG